MASSFGGLRKFRMDKEKEIQGQSTILRFIRRSKGISSPSSSGSEDTTNGESPMQRLVNETVVKNSNHIAEEKSTPKTPVKNFMLIQPPSPESGGNTADPDSSMDSTDSPLIRSKTAKRLRVESDDDSNSSSSAAKRPHMNGESDHNSTESPGISEDMMEKYIDTLMSLYPFCERMEIMDIMMENGWNFVDATQKLDLQATQKKNQALLEKRSLKMQLLAEQKQVKKEIKDRERQYKIECRERQKQQKIEIEQKLREERQQMLMSKKMERLNKREQQKQKRKIWKHHSNRDIESDEGEDDSYDVGSKNVYFSDSEGEDDFEMTPAREMVLKFFNEASVKELIAIPTCSKKKVENIIKLRKFEDWEDIVKKIRGCKFVSTDVLNYAKDALQKRSLIQNLMKKCERIAQQIAENVTDVINGEDDSRVIRQPEILNPELCLKNYQLIGLNWLALMHQNDLNGILADEMGLGKTIQAISFLAYIKETEENRSLSLIIVPSSTLDNWARELELWCPDLSILQYRGSQEERRGMRNALLLHELGEDIEVILTTYTMVTSSSEDRALFKKQRFHTVIFDEAHMLKNMTSLRYENLMKIKAQRRVLLTGTPLQNNLVELMSILVFVMPSLFEGKKDQLKDIFSMFPKIESDGDGRGQFEEEKIQQAKRILKPFFLRRLKTDVLKDLPTKTEELILVPMATKQQEMYTSLVQRLSKKAIEMKQKLDDLKVKELTELEDLQASSGIDNSPKQKKVFPEEFSTANMVMTLRKCANHPLLIRNHYTNKKIKEMSKVLHKTSHRNSVLEYIEEDLCIMSDFEIHQTCAMYNSINKYSLDSDKILYSGKFQQLDTLLPKLQEEGSRVLIFSQFVIVLDIIEQYLKLRDYKYSRLDGRTQVSERQELIDEFNEDEEIFIFLLSTRAGGLGINLTSADTVILHDIDFNPYNDKQAEDRCHRVGQTKPVKIIRLISDGTIENGMHRIAEEKLKLERDVTSQGETTKKSDVLTLLKTSLGLSKDNTS